jgi:hypothetical protein
MKQDSIYAAKSGIKSLGSMHEHFREDWKYRND